MSSVSLVPLIPREVLFGNPSKASPQVSPDGKTIAYLAPVNNVLNVWVKTIGADDDRAITNDTYRGIRLFFWIGDSQHILFGQDVGGDENFHLYATHVQTRETRDLTPFENITAYPIHADNRLTTELLIALNKDDPRAHDAYRLNILTGELTLAAKNPGNISSWASDGHLNIKAAWASDEMGGAALLVREGGDGAESTWQRVGTWGADDALTSRLDGLSHDGSTIFLHDSRNANTGRFIKMAVTTGKMQLIAEDAHYDAGQAIFHPDTYQPQLISFQRARQEWVVLDEAIQADIEAIRKIQPGDFSLLNRDHADQIWLIEFSTDDGPVAYYAYNRRTRNATFLFHSQPELAQHQLANIEPISFAARDGLMLHGYITYPVGVVRQNLPLVLDVHGGPWGRNGWGFDAQTQWFANRGYACLQINFRGSTGYGKDFVNAGDREWGGAMHNDLIDAVNWAVQQGIADPKRVAIFGWSYGGYSALVGATFTPDVFCCAVDAIGPSELVTLLETIPPYWAPLKNMMYRRVGDPAKDAEFLKSRSPLYKADQIKIPMLIAQGANDPRVKQAQAEMIVEALRRNEVDHEYLLFADEGHGFERPENRLKFYAATEKFLATHLGGRFEG